MAGARRHAAMHATEQKTSSCLGRHGEEVYEQRQRRNDGADRYPPPRRILKTTQFYRSCQIHLCPPQLMVSSHPRAAVEDEASCLQSADPRMRQRMNSTACREQGLHKMRRHMSEWRIAKCHTRRNVKRRCNGLTPRDTLRPESVRIHNFPPLVLPNLSSHHLLRGDVSPHVRIIRPRRPLGRESGRSSVRGNSMTGCCMSAVHR